MTEDGERIWEQLTRIADALEILAAAVSMPEPEETPEPTCSHPPAERISFGTTNGQEDWQCSICQFRPV